MNELRDCEKRLLEVNDTIQKENTKKGELTKDLDEKVTQEGKMEDTLRLISLQINQIEKIEYPGDNERKMLVSYLVDRITNHHLPSG